MIKKTSRKKQNTQNMSRFTPAQKERLLARGSEETIVPIPPPMWRAPSISEMAMQRPNPMLENIHIRIFMPHHTELEAAGLEGIGVDRQDVYNTGVWVTFGMLQYGRSDKVRWLAHPDRRRRVLVDVSGPVDADWVREAVREYIRMVPHITAMPHANPPMHMQIEAPTYREEIGDVEGIVAMLLAPFGIFATGVSLADVEFK
jgi:hypothetical protein